MITRKERREAEKKINYLLEFQKITNHFFKDFNKWLKNVADMRNQSYITYPPEVLLLMLIMKHVTGLKSMREMTIQFNTDQAIKNVGIILNLPDLSELPHYDTINNFLEKLHVDELEKLRYNMVRRLINKKSLNRYRLGINGIYHWKVAVDGTGLFTFKERHCDHCLTRERTNSKTGEVSVTYYHHVLEAKLVLGDMVISLATEFIENEREGVTKQDCELKAFYRLSARLKKAFPRLNICILGDSLYACGPVFELCEANNWQYIFRFKDGSIPTVARKYGVLKEEATDNQTIKHFGEEKWEMRWANGIGYQGKSLHICELAVYEADELTQTFAFLASFLITEKNVERVVRAGRSRWRIENEGFNRQKNHRGYIQHLNSHDSVSMKNHYLIIQIAEIIMVLFEKGLDFFQKYHKTIKEKSSKLLEAFRLRTLTEEDLTWLEIPIQIRFT